MHHYLPTTVIFEQEQLLAVSTVQDANSGDIILKLVSRSDNPLPAEINLSGVPSIAATANVTVISGDPLDENLYSFWRTRITTPRTESINIAPEFTYTLPAHSLTIIRIKTRNVATVLM